MIISQIRNPIRKHCKWPIQLNVRRAIKWFRDNGDLAKVTGSIVQSAILRLIPFLLSLYGAEILQMDWVFANNLEFAFSAQGHSVRSDIKD